MMFSKEQLIDAQHAYNLEWKNNPEDFNTELEFLNQVTENDKSCAIRQIEYLLSKVKD